VKKSGTDQEIALGEWVFGQRKLRDSMATKRLKMLESLEGWSWGVLEDQFSSNFKILEEYVADTGHASPPARYKSPCGFQLGVWVSNLRKGKLNTSAQITITTERKESLEALPGWSWSPRDDEWEVMLLELKNYFYNNSGRNKVSKKESTKLYYWCKKQKKDYSNGDLTDHRIVNLQSLKNWVWD